MKTVEESKVSSFCHPRLLRGLRVYGIANPCIQLMSEERVISLL